MPTAGVLKRVTSAIVLVPLLVGVVTLGPPWLFDLLVIGVAALASLELAGMFTRAGCPLSPGLPVAGAATVTASFAIPGGAVPALTLAVLVALSAAVWRTGPPAVEPVAATLLALTYVGWLLGHALTLRRLPDGAIMVVFVLGVTWAGETAAYAIGSAVGRRPLAPRVSPRKTVEGAVAQVAVSVAAAGLLGAWLPPGWGLGRTLGAGLLLGLVGQVGDLAESVMKRSLGTKDAGGLIPGHGGLLDRLDGLLFNVPALVYYVRMTGGVV